MPWSDFNIELTTQTDGDIERNTDIYSIKNSLTNIVNTLKGSRRMLPEFAVNVQKLLFEPITQDTAYELGQTLLSGIRTWDNRVKIDDILVNGIIDENMYECNVNFTIVTPNGEVNDSIQFILKQQ